VQAQSNAVPLLEYVITATSNKVAFSTTLADSLNLLVGGASTTPTGTVSTTPGTPGTTHHPGRQRVGPEPRPAGPAAPPGLPAGGGQGDFATAGQELAALASGAADSGLAQPDALGSPARRPRRPRAEREAAEQRSRGSW